MKRSNDRELERTAYHEAGHAVLQIALGIGCEGVTIVPNYRKGTAGAATHGGEWGKPAQQLGEQDDDVATLRTALQTEGAAVPCSHCGGTGFEGDEPCEFCAASGRQPAAPPLRSPADALLGIAWWNALTRPERLHWLQLANSDCPADAWAAYQEDIARR